MTPISESTNYVLYLWLSTQLYTDADTYIWRSPLHLAATFGDRDVRFITLLLSKGADINQLSHGDREFIVT